MLVMENEKYPSWNGYKQRMFTPTPVVIDADTEVKFISLRQSQVCPVCSGKQTVPAGFYHQGDYSSTSAAPETCRSCGGKGIVWGE